jgi:hypothetical protein
MERRHLLTVVLLLAAAGPLHAGDVTGTWTAQTPSRGGGMETTTFEFRVDGKKLSGTVKVSGRTYPIREGTIDGDSLRFHFSVNVGREVNFVHTGKVVGEEIRFAREMQGMGLRTTFVAKRPAERR